MKQLITTPSHHLCGELRVAADKSITHRAILLSSLTNAHTTIENPLLSDDTIATMDAMRALGVAIETDNNDTRLLVRSDGLLKNPNKDIDCANSGTLMRLLAGVAVGQQLNCRLIGDASLMSRPMKRITDPLTLMGASISTDSKGVPPLMITPNPSSLKAILYYNYLASAQIKSSLLLAGIFAQGTTIIAEPHLSRDHSERLLSSFGISLQRSDDLRIVAIDGGQSLKSPETVCIPADISSAMFFIVAAAMNEGSDMTLKEVGINSGRAGALELLLRMGADIDIKNQRCLGQEPVADIRVRGGQLHGIDINPEMVPSAIDDFPALLIAAASAKGQTRLWGASELRHKECDRLSAMHMGLQTLGINCQEQADGICIDGKGGQKNTFNSGTVNSLGDHRIAMAFCLASSQAKGDIIINHCNQIKTSFPNFVKLANAAGLRVIEKQVDTDDNH